jgi:hypothetical protein
MSRPDRARIRPSVLLLAAFFAGIAALVVWVALDGRVAPHRSPVVELDHVDGRRDRGRDHDRGERRRAHAGPTRASGDYVHHDWGEESDLGRRMALGLPEPGFWQQRATRGAPEDDPQLAAMWRSFHGMAAEDGEPPLPFEPTAHRARLVQAEGDVSASPTSCDVRVLPVRASRFNCVVRVMCDGRVLYPNPSQSAGYVPCEVQDGRPVRAVDDGHTSRDGDPLVSLDLQQGTVTVEDFDAQGARRYRATLRVDG